MANLIIIDSEKGTRNLNEQEVHPEGAIEKIIFETRHLVRKIYYQMSFFLNVN